MVKILIFIFFLGPCTLLAQSVITGRVLIQNGEPVRGVNVYCPEKGAGTSSDSSGYFELECEIPCTIEFSHLNYKTEMVRVSSNDAPFVVTLRNKQNNLKEVIIAARSVPGRFYSSRKGIDMIPAILGEQDILKYLATTPGIVSTNALDPGIYVRGGNSYENGFLTNDMEIASPDHLTGILSTFDPYILNNSTIYKSGFPAAYNSYLSSYINMRPDVGNKERFEGEISLGLVSSALKAKGPLVKNHTSFAVSARTSYLQAIARLYNQSIKNPDDPNYMPEYSFNDLTFSLDSRLSNQWRLNAFGLFTKDALTLKLSENIRYDFDWHTCSANIGATYTPDARNSFRFQLGEKLAYSQGNAEGSIPMGGGNRHYSIIGRVAYSHSFSDKLQFNAGMKFEQAKFETADRPEGIGENLILSSDNNFNISETYIDINYHLNQSFTFNGGLNYQLYNGASVTHALSPRAKLSYSRGGFSVWADYSQTTQYLSLYPYFAVKTPVDIWYPLAKGMKPAICHQYSIGMGQEVGSWLSVYLGLFYKNMKHLKDFSSGMSTRYTTLTDEMIEGKGYARGVELNLAFTSTRLSARINYTLSESKRKFAQINQGRAFNPPYDVKHNIVVNGSYDITSRLTLNALWTYSSGVYTTFPVGMALAHDIAGSNKPPIIVPVYTDRYNYQLPASHRLDMNLDYHIPYKHAALKLSVGAYNIYNQSNPSFIYFKPVRTGGDMKVVPQSKVILPFIPYISLRLNL